MRGDTLLLCEPCLKCLGESEEGGLPAPLRHNEKKTNKKNSDFQRKVGTHINVNMKPSSTYFPESLPEGCVEGTLGALCHENVKTDNQNVEGKTQSAFISF